MSKYNVKTLWITSTNQRDIDVFDEGLEKALNDGYEIIGNIRTTTDEGVCDNHFVTMKKLISDEGETAITNCAICALRKTCGVNEFKKEFKTATVIECGDFLHETNYIKATVGEPNE